MSLADGITQLRQALTQAGVTVTMVGVEPIGGQDAYHFVLTLPLDQINTALAGQKASLHVNSASADFWLYTKDLTMAQVVFKGAGNSTDLSLTLTLTNYNAPVTIVVPWASEVIPQS
jgi:hypothetical protein